MTLMISHDINDISAVSSGA